MAEPHQRIQSGKLRPSSKRPSYTNKDTNTKKVHEVAIGIQNSTLLETIDSDDIYDHFMQTPMALTNLHTTILSDIAQECGISNADSINKEWRNTWNIGTWCIGNKVSLSINFMQPNIASTWITVTCTKHEDFGNIVDKYSSSSLEKSSLSAVRSSSGYQVRGRWGLHVVEESILLNTIKKDAYEIGSINICQSRVFLWMLIGDNSEYLCTLTQDSIVLLAKYIPDWCLDIQEPTEAKNITFRIKNPSKVNDNSQLSITTSGWLQFNGRVDNAAKLYGALSTALRDIVESISLKSFLESLHYEELPPCF